MKKDPLRIRNTFSPIFSLVDRFYFCFILPTGSGSVSSMRIRIQEAYYIADPIGSGSKKARLHTTGKDRKIKEQLQEGSMPEGFKYCK